MVKDLIIIGAGGFAREASLMVEEINCSIDGEESWQLLGFIDDDKAKWGLALRGYPVLGGWEALEKLPRDVQVICVVGDPATKRKLVLKAEEQGRSFANLVHPEVVFGEEVSIGKGVLINKGCLLTVNIRIGDHVSINPGCGIGHDAVIGDYATLMWRVNISGNVRIGEGCLLGTGSIVLQEKVVGRSSIVGAGAVVTTDLPEGCTAIGVPARERERP